MLANITNGLENIGWHAVVIYALENDQYKIKDSQGSEYEIPKDRCTSMQVQSFCFKPKITRAAAGCGKFSATKMHP